MFKLETCLVLACSWCGGSACIGFSWRMAPEAFEKWLSRCTETARELRPLAP